MPGLGQGDGRRLRHLGSAEEPGSLTWLHGLRAGAQESAAVRRRPGPGPHPCAVSSSLLLSPGCSRPGWSPPAWCSLADREQGPLEKDGREEESPEPWIPFSPALTAHHCPEPIWRFLVDSWLCPALLASVPPLLSCLSKCAVKKSPEHFFSFDPHI